jgi:TonB-dependent SusC/RagA subfamily outer membrane receptor
MQIPLYVVMVFLLLGLKFDKLLRYRINNGIKDASATSIYGSRGANGVILITTKTGRLVLHISKLKLS